MCGHDQEKGIRIKKYKANVIMTASEVKEGQRRLFSRASQKDHLSCVRGSIERVGDSDGG